MLSSAKALETATYSAEPVEAVLKLREEYPRWGKEKLATLLKEKGNQVSASMVGRIIRRLKERGVLKEPISNHISARKCQRQRAYAVRKPKGYEVSRMGDLGVQAGYQTSTRGITKAFHSL